MCQPKPTHKEWGHVLIHGQIKTDAVNRNIEHRTRRANELQSDNITRDVSHQGPNEAALRQWQGEPLAESVVAYKQGAGTGAGSGSGTVGGNVGANARMVEADANDIAASAVVGLAVG